MPSAIYTEELLHVDTHSRDIAAERDRWIFDAVAGVGAS